MAEAIAKLIDLNDCPVIDYDMDIDLIDACYREVKIDPNNVPEPKVLTKKRNFCVFKKNFDF